MTARKSSDPASSPISAMATLLQAASQVTSQVGSMVSSLSGLAPIKKHVFQAGREVLLAFRELLQIVDQYIENVSDGIGSQQALHLALGYAHSTIDRLVRQLPHTGEEDYRTVHRQVMHSILEVLESEISRSTKAKSQKSKMKVEVLEAIRKVLLKEMYEKESL